MASGLGDQRMMKNCSYTEIGSSSQSLWKQRVLDVSMGWGWSASKNEPVQLMSGPLPLFGGATCSQEVALEVDSWVARG